MKLAFWRRHDGLNAEVEAKRRELERLIEARKIEHGERQRAIMMEHFTAEADD